MLQEGNVVAFYDLKATSQVCRHPTADKADPVRHQTPPFTEPGINSLGIVVAEMLDHHKQHHGPFVGLAHEHPAGGCPAIGVRKFRIACWGSWQQRSESDPFA